MQADEPTHGAAQRHAPGRQHPDSERPRRLQALLGRTGLAIGGRLPFGAAYRLGGWVGRAAHRLGDRNCAVTRINLGLCLPGLSQVERERLARESLASAGRVVCEIPGIWSRSRERTLELLREAEGRELIDEARAAGRGVLVLSPHLGNWELGGLYLSMLGPTTSMYRPPRVRGMDDFYRAKRARFGAELVPADGTGVRAVIAALRGGGIVGMLPDQDPGFGSGIFVPYFGVLANTSPLVPKLLRKTGALGVTCTTLRLPEARGFRTRIRVLEQDLLVDDEARATTAMNREMERLVREAPEQYLWSYKRFKARPPGGERFYDGI